jgi:hypothetical protein
MTACGSSSARRAILTLTADRIRAALLVALVCVVLPAAARGDTTVRIGGPQAVAPIAPGFAGLALEFNYADKYAGNSPTDLNPVYEQFVRNLAPGTSPILRIGGDSTDHAWVPAPGIRHQAGLTFRVTNTWLATIARFARDVNARLMMGVNLEANDARLAAVEARTFVTSIGRTYVRSLQLGNEPSLWHAFAWSKTPAGVRVAGRPRGWSVPKYLREYTAVRRVLPLVPLGGPDLGDVTWMEKLNQFLGAEPSVREVTFHRYGGNACFGRRGTPDYPSIANLLSAADSRGLAARSRGYARIAAAHGASIRVDEINSESCSGRYGVSDTFASALWELDTLFAMAQVGISGVNIQTYPHAWYRLFSFGKASGRWWGHAYPDYYGLVMFARAAPPGSRLLSVGAPAGSEPWLRVWATQATDGTVRVLLLDDSPTAARSVQLRLPAGIGAGAGNLVRLRAPSVGARDGVTLGGQSFASQSGTGMLAGAPQTTAVTPVGGAVQVALPAGSATLLTLPAGSP